MRVSEYGTKYIPAWLGSFKTHSLPHSSYICLKYMFLHVIRSKILSYNAINHDVPIRDTCSEQYAIPNLSQFASLSLQTPPENCPASAKLAF